eukprot:Gb_31023 [translate_table: standard]
MLPLLAMRTRRGLDHSYQHKPPAPSRLTVNPKWPLCLGPPPVTKKSSNAIGSSLHLGTRVISIYNEIPLIKTTRSLALPTVAEDKKTPKKGLSFHKDDKEGFDFKNGYSKVA